MGLWDKVKDAAQKAADAAKDQVNREDSLLNKTVEAGKKAADKAVVVAKDQYYRQDSTLNKAISGTAATSDKVLGHIDAIDSGQRNDEIAMAKRYAAKRKAEAEAGFGEVEMPEEHEVGHVREEDKVKFPNSQQLTDEEVYKKVSETIYTDFRTLPAGDKKWALCEIARYDKRVVNLMRAIGSAYIDTLRQLAEGDEGYQAALDAAGLARDAELKRAFQNWLDDSYDEAFYKDDDGGHVKAVRLVGSLVYSRIGGEAGEKGGEPLSQAMGDAGVKDVYGVARLVAAAKKVIEARDAVINQAFKPRRTSFASQYLVHKGINADHTFVWLGKDGRPDGSDDVGGGEESGGFAGGSLMEL